MANIHEYNSELPDDQILEEVREEEQYERFTFIYEPDKINIVTKEITIWQLLRRINEDALDLAPDFKRRAGIWTEDVKSRLIESILIRIPLPAFYIDATNEDKWVVVDGLQRLFAIKQFVSDQTLRLHGLEYILEVEGKNYYELERKYQRRLEETSVVVFLIEKGTPPEVKYNIFKRINTGGLSLSNQELRHALNPGKGIKFLSQLAVSPEFQKIVNLTNARKMRMDDQELILGFLALMLDNNQNYKYRNRDFFLNEALYRANRLSNEELKKIEISFKKAMIAASDIFGENAFRRISTKKKYPINKGLFEAWSVHLAKMSEKDLEKLKKRKQILIEKFSNYLDRDEDFLVSISQVANKVEYRLSIIEKIIQEVLS